MKIVRTVRVDKPAAEVFAYLADFTTTTQWDPGTVRTVREQGDGGIGTTYRNTSRFLGRRTELVYRVVHRHEPDVIQLVGTNSTVTATDTIEVRALAAGTEVTYTADFAFSGFAALAAPLLRLPLKRLGDQAAAGMRTALERL
ncbi:MAG TPA: SRPBCC family protein [Mycobacteriales bacterium]|nr:SRPBCC family protein [Mycobacteriales bacterium]